MQLNISVALLYYQLYIGSNIFAINYSYSSVLLSYFAFITIYYTNFAIEQIYVLN